MEKYKRRGWYGNSYGHSLAARGIKLYAKKNASQPMFFTRQEEKVPLSLIREMIEEGLTYQDMLTMHESSDEKYLRHRGIQTIDGREGNNVLSSLYNDNEKVIARKMQDDYFKKKVRNVINDRQKASFIPDAKLEVVKRYV